MRVLVVDDDHEKVTLIRSFLVGRGVASSDVLSAEHAAGARVLLANEAVDVLLIDVLLPARHGAAPLGTNSVELLRQIVEDGTSPAPRHIIGITASPAALAEFEDEFRSLVLQVLHVAPGERDWQGALNAFMLHLGHINDARESNDYDICVLNALRVPELDAVIATWPLQLDAEKLINRNIVYRSGAMLLNGVKKRVVCAHLSQMGPIASAHAATVLLEAFRPRVMLMTGICGGFADHVSIGDVVVAEKSWDWQAGKWTEEGALATALDQRDGSAELIAQARGVEATLEELYQAYVGKRPDAPPKLAFGPIVTGSSVVASLDIQKVFRNQHRKMVGVDMECYGLYYAAENHAGAPVHVLCIKSVSDLADRAKGDDFQRYCSHMSALVALDVVKRHFGH
jgi:nucleoside phosphorylase/CheY-like chemotaxis protein